jgi:LemA protein
MNLWIAGSVAVVVFAALALVRTYNRLVRLRNDCDNSFAQIDVQLKRRLDLIPNLVECVRGYMSHERETLERVLAARRAAARERQLALQQPGAGAAWETWLGAERDLGQALGTLWVALESYPDLKASRSVAELTEQLTSTENRIAFARQAYNDWVLSFNSYRQTLPQCVFAQLFGFNDNRKFLQLGSAAELSAAPAVALS